MNKKSVTAKVALTAVAIVVVAAGLTAGSATAGSDLWPSGTTSPEAGAPAEARASVYERNQAGETYGSAGEASSPADEPDLILVQATNGRTGYVRASELNEASGANVSSEKEALAWNAKSAERAASGQNMVSVYDKSGVTVIGEFSAIG